MDEVSYACGIDKRIGPHFLKASVGFGGSCFQKDILNLVYLAGSLGLPEVAAYWKQVVDMNEYSKLRFTERIIRSLFNTITNKKITLFGFAFKKDTTDTRESAAITLCKYLLEENAFVSIYDPKVEAYQIKDDLTNSAHYSDAVSMEKCNFLFKLICFYSVDKKVSIESDPYKAARDADAVVILTEWDCFKSLDYGAIYDNMRKPAFLFDGRNIVDCAALQKIGFKVKMVVKL